MGQSGFDNIIVLQLNDWNTISVVRIFDFLMYTDGIDNIVQIPSSVHQRTPLTDMGYITDEISMPCP